MRIAQVAPLFESVPPRLMGTQRVVSYPTEELVDRRDALVFAMAKPPQTLEIQATRQVSVPMGGPEGVASNAQERGLFSMRRVPSGRGRWLGTLERTSSSFARPP